jgi:hypothetical protein
MMEFRVLPFLLGRVDSYFSQILEAARAITMRIAVIGKCVPKPQAHRHSLYLKLANATEPVHLQHAAHGQRRT